MKLIFQVTLIKKLLSMSPLHPLWEWRDQTTSSRTLHLLHYLPFSLPYLLM